ncbi:MAG TPA: NirA family protein [Stellaceae bacterium]|nr:NirA family protein [Stellaceae bacterium]
MAQDRGFSAEQKEYLEGFIAALAKKRGMPVPQFSAAGEPDGQAARDPSHIHTAAQDRWLREGKALAPEELAKRAKHPFEMWDEMLANAAAERFPKGLDVFLHKFHGLFYVAPNQNAYMLRLRLPGGLLRAAQADGIADLARRFGGGYVDVTTRANLQIREIGAAHPIAVLTALDELGLTSRGAGADNIRNLTGSPAAGIDPEELYDTRPLGHELYHYILNHRELYGLPRKFNVAFDGGGRLSVLADTNDIGFAAVRIRPGKSAAAGVYFRMLLGGVTGHGFVAGDSGVLLAPHEVVPAAVAIIRLFIDHGDRTDRKRARLAYLVERWGIEKCLTEAAAFLPFPWRLAPLDECEPRRAIDKHGHIGIHPQAQAGRFYLGVALPVGRLTANQLAGLAAIAQRYGAGVLRLTVWQNLLISDIAETDLTAAQAAIAALGLSTSASHLRGGLVACTGNAGCKFALSDTKRHAIELADYLDARLRLDEPLNIHLTGCPNSCAQHYVGDIGLLATKVDKGETEVEGYHLLVGGGSGDGAGLAHEICRSLPADEVPRRVEAILRGYLDGRRPQESLRDFARRHSVEELARLAAAPAAGLE